jgi:hypothetical protein
MLSARACGPLRGPHIYSIVVRDCLYIGETQQLPVKRWAEHLSSGGSFRTSFSRADEEFDDRSTSLSFFALACSQIHDVLESERRLVTQYIEHRLHVVCALRMARLAPIRRIISNTVHTAPLSCRYPWADDIATRAFDTFLEAWREQGLVRAASSQ